MAAKKEHILFDKTELVLVILDSKGGRLMNVNADDIQAIQISPCKEKKGLLKNKEIDSEQILFKLKRDPENPITYLKSAEETFWDGYKTGLASFAKKNKLSFTDSIEPVAL